ncbi:hypothetical protein CDAR_452121 [Caerostris darwini]|uniref:Uncharacterized protein n=1 Tax=Caerostris darwini TaxID=1538125 RepID=A0AAV4PME5_9ARAC|nr:hypothetical protein CDAR_452121 [Caerostris darwini]
MTIHRANELQCVAAIPMLHLNCKCHITITVPNAPPSQPSVRVDLLCFPLHAAKSPWCSAHILLTPITWTQSKHTSDREMERKPLLFRINYELIGN